MTPHTVVRRASRPARRNAAAADPSAPEVRKARASEPLLLTNDEAAALLHIGRTTLYQLVWDGKLTPLRIGRSVRFTRDQLEEFVNGLRDGN